VKNGIYDLKAIKNKEIGSIQNNGFITVELKVANDRLNVTLEKYTGNYATSTDSNGA
jgi:hypothetical protein